MKHLQNHILKNSARSGKAKNLAVSIRSGRIRRGMYRWKKVQSVV
jgi:hypothetical protein